jgi:hypothetical protein
MHDLSPQPRLYTGPGQVFGGTKIAAVPSKLAAESPGGLVKPAQAVICLAAALLPAACTVP